MVIVQTITNKYQPIAGNQAFNDIVRNEYFCVYSFIKIHSFENKKQYFLTCNKSLFQVENIVFFPKNQRYLLKNKYLTVFV